MNWDWSDCLQKSAKRSWNSSRSCRETETNLTELDDFVNVHEITFKDKLGRVWRGWFLFLSSYKDWRILSPADCTVNDWGSRPVDPTNCWSIYRTTAGLSASRLLPQPEKTSPEADRSEEERRESPFIFWNQRSNWSNPTKILLHIKNVHFTLH